MKRKPLLTRLKDHQQQIRGSTTADLLEEVHQELQQSLAWLRTLLVDDYKEDWPKIAVFLEKHEEY
jgi:hypothetical protein